AAAEKAARVLQEQGAHVEEADPPLGGALDIIRAMWWPTAASIVDAVPPPRRAEMDPGFLHIAERGRHYTATDYLNAYTARSQLHIAMRGFHERYDLLLTPAMPIAALKVRRENAGRGRIWRRLAELVALYVSVQSDRAAGGISAVRADKGGIADRFADRRCAAGRQDGAAGGAGARTSDAVSTALGLKFVLISNYYEYLLQHLM